MLGPTHSSPRAVGRYLLAGPIAVGGMASVHFGLLNGPRGFRRTVAIKRMLQTYAVNPQARLMLVDEARLASRVSHANVVQTLDVVEDQDELFLVLEYVHGESFDKLLERAQELGQKAPPKVASAVVVGALRGLHAAHEAKDEGGQPLELVHRDLSPHNVLVDVNGVARVLDFGVARARGRLQGTRDGQLKGKLAYLAPEQVHGEASRRSDLFTAGVVLWEALAGRQLFRGNSEADLLSQVLLCKVPSLAELGVEVAPALQAVLDQALARAPEDRFATAAQLADALEACGVASAAEVAGWVKDLAADTLAQRTAALEGLEKLPAPDALAPPAPARPAPAPVRPPPSPALLAGAVALVLLLAAAAWGLTAVLQRTLAEVPSTPTTQPAPVTPPPPLAAPTPVAPTPTPVVVEPAPVKPATKPLVTAKKPEPKPEPAKPGASCDPPFTIDASGVKHYKLECLK